MRWCCKLAVHNLLAAADDGRLTVRASDLFATLRRPTGPDDVAFKITHCGLCHGELIWIFNKDRQARYPMVPGHEVAGVVTEVGRNVTHVKPGDRVGVGCYCNSCRRCEYCADGMENFCVNHSTFTYNGNDEDGSITMGGLSTWMVTHQRHAA